LEEPSRSHSLTNFDSKVLRHDFPNVSLSVFYADAEDAIVCII